MRYITVDGNYFLKLILCGLHSLVTLYILKFIYLYINTLKLFEPDDR